MAERRRDQDRFDTDGCYVELDIPEGAKAVIAQDLKVGDRIFFHRAFRTIAEIEDYAPPMPEDIQGLIAEMQHHALLGDMRKVSELSRTTAASSMQIAREFGDEIRVRFDSSRWPTRLRIAHGTQCGVQDKQAARKKRARTPGPKLTEIADRIHAHLQRMEADETINRFPEPERADLRPFFHARAVRTGSVLNVKYVSYQNEHKLTRDEALIYLNWLDAGNNGRHFTPIGEHKRAQRAAARDADASAS